MTRTFLKIIDWIIAPVIIICAIILYTIYKKKYTKKDIKHEIMAFKKKQEKQIDIPYILKYDSENKTITVKFNDKVKSYRYCIITPTKVVEWKGGFDAKLDGITENTIKKHNLIEESDYIVLSTGDYHTLPKNPQTINLLDDAKKEKKIIGYKFRKTKVAVRMYNNGVNKNKKVSGVFYGV